MSTEGESKLLTELRVTELKAELDKRGLDKNGIKIILTDRLEKALKAEGHDPSTYKFFISETSVPSTPQKAKEEMKSEGTDEDINTAEVEVSCDGAGEEGTEKSVQDADESQNVTKDEDEEEETQGEEEQLEDPLNEQPSEKNGSEAPRNGHPPANDPGCMFWVRGLNPSTKAADLRELFSQHGKVVRAKIFTSKKTPGKTFGLVTVAESDMVEKCYIAQDNKPWNGTVITIEKGNASNMSSKAAAAANATVTRKESTKAPTEEHKVEVKKDEKERKEEGGKGIERKPSNDGKEREKEREKRDADHSKNAKPRREPIREPRHDSRKTITAARRPHIPTSSRPSFHPPISSRLSRPHVRHTPPSRRVESYGRSDADRERLRAREEELRRRAAEMELEKEKERLRAERERIEREKLELQLLKQQVQLAAYERAASHGGSSRHRDEPVRSSGARRDERYSSRSSESLRSHERPIATRDRDHRSSRTDERRAPVPTVDRSRSRHDPHRDTAVHRDSRYTEPPRREVRHEGPPSRPAGSTYGGRGYAREPQGISNGQNFYGSRDSYSSGVTAPQREYENSTRAPPASGGTWSSGNGGSWSGIPADNNWGVKSNDGGGNWSNYGGAGSNHGGAGSNPPNVRIDYEKYRRQRQF